MKLLNGHLEPEHIDAIVAASLELHAETTYGPLAAPDVVEFYQLGNRHALLEITDDPRKAAEQIGSVRTYFAVHFSDDD